MLDPVAAGDRVTAGALVVVFEGVDALRAVTVTPGEVLRCRHGAFPHASWVGRRYGARVHAAGAASGAWLLLLRPTPALWTRVLRHRTQILYTPDVGAIVQGLGLGPGRLVLESGTGSGSLTTSLARAVAPSGAVYSFEFHAQRAAAAREDFAATGVAACVRVFVRDTEATGFPASLAASADAVFLDLPGPHKIAAAAAAVLRPDGRICSFSPCIEQVQRMCAALAAAGFVEPLTVEVLDREYEFHQRQLLLPPARGEAPVVSLKRPREEGEGTAEEAAAEAALPGAEPAAGAAPEAGGRRRGAAKEVLPQAEPRLLAWPIAEARGHTGYLTFARKPTETAA